MKVQTLGHASILLTNRKHEPLLLTDPWLVGSCYWRSWWLQNYPDEEQLDMLSTVQYCYITHEHQDHYHLPSIRKLGKQPVYLSPQLPEENISPHLVSLGFTAKTLIPLTWYRIDEEVNVLSIPLYNDDSCLLIDTPTAYIVNLNDSKPTNSQLRNLRYYLSANPSKKVVALSSYSPASIVNSFRKDGEYVSIKNKQAYIDYLNNLVTIIDADYFIPFASQAIFCRPDSKWANGYKVTIDDIAKGWKARTTLLRPYSTIDLDTFCHTSVPTEQYKRTVAPIEKKVAGQMILESDVSLSAMTLSALESKLRIHRFVLWPLFPKGVCFVTEQEQYHFSTIKGRFIKSNTNPSFAIRVPAKALGDAVTFGHFGDLGITMFTVIILRGKTNPRLIYVFFMLLTLYDYRHTASIKGFCKWLKSSLRVHRWRIPPIDDPKPVHAGSSVPGALDHT